MTERGSWGLVAPRKELQGPPTHKLAEKCFYRYVAASGNFQLIVTDYQIFPPITKPDTELTTVDIYEKDVAIRAAEELQKALHRRETLWYQPKPLTIPKPSDLQADAPSPIISPH